MKIVDDPRSKVELSLQRYFIQFLLLNGCPSPKRCIYICICSSSKDPANNNFFWIHRWPDHRYIFAFIAGIVKTRFLHSRSLKPLGSQFLLYPLKKITLSMNNNINCFHVIYLGAQEFITPFIR